MKGVNVIDSRYLTAYITKLGLTGIGSLRLMKTVTGALNPFGKGKTCLFEVLRFPSGISIWLYYLCVLEITVLLFQCLNCFIFHYGFKDYFNALRVSYDHFLNKGLSITLLAYLPFPLF